MLHILSETPLDTVVFERMAVGDQILLIEDAVIEILAGATHAQQWRVVQKSKKVFVLNVDLEIRGLQSTNIVDGIEVIDYQGFVQLTIDNEVIHSWH